MACQNFYRYTIEHSHRLNYFLIWQLRGCRSQGPTEGSGDSGAHHWLPSPLLCKSSTSHDALGDYRESQRTTATQALNCCHCCRLVDVTEASRYRLLDSQTFFFPQAIRLLTFFFVPRFYGVCTFLCCFLPIFAARVLHNDIACVCVCFCVCFGRGVWLS